MFEMVSQALAVLRGFGKNEDGLALVEYLILLAILSGATVAAVFIFANNIGAQWALWANWFSPANLSNTASSG